MRLFSWRRRRVGRRGFVWLRLLPLCRAKVRRSTSTAFALPLAYQRLYDPKHADLAEQIRSVRQANQEFLTNDSTNSNKSNLAKDAQIIRFKERIRTLEEQVRALKEENELLYGKLLNQNKQPVLEARTARTLFRKCVAGERQCGNEISDLSESVFQLHNER